MSRTPSAAIGRRICELLLDRKHTQTWLAHRVGVRQPIVSAWINGADISVTDLVDIAAAFKLPVTALCPELGDQVAHLLTAIREVDPSRNGTANAPDAEARYRRRNALVYRLMAAALTLGWHAGIGFGEIEPGVTWPIVYVDLPAGQVSWHVVPYPQPWDGHTNDEKYQRCFAYVHERDTAATS